MRRFASLSLAALALSLCSAAPASAYPLGIEEKEVHVLTAWGEGSVTRCVVTITSLDWFPKDQWSYSGKTECGVPIEQSGQAFLMDHWGVKHEGGLCSGFTTTCSSSGEDYGDNLTVRYDITLRAPRGQAWSVPPNVWTCEGAGSDYLSCSL